MVGRVVVINSEVTATGLTTGYFEVWAVNFFGKRGKVMEWKPEIARQHSITKLHTLILAVYFKT